MGKNIQKINDLNFKLGLLLAALVMALSPVLFLPARHHQPVNTANASKQIRTVKYIRVMLNNSPLHADALPCIIDSSAMVPLRPLVLATGASVRWDPTRDAIEVTCDGKIIKMTVGKTRAYIGDREVDMQVAPQYMNGAALVPINFIKDPLKLNVSWDSTWRTLHLSTPGFTPPPEDAKVSQTQSFPILMYHEIGDGPNSLYVRESEFREQMKYLKDNNYRVVALTQAIHMLQNHESMQKVVALTFDDGYISFFTRAWPILHEYGFHATVFVIAYYSYLPNYLNWEQISMLESDWNEIGSHSENHPALSALGKSRLTDEVAGSKACIESHLQVPCESFCYPGGNYNQTVVQAVRDAGYKAAVTTKYGRASSNSDIYLIPRIRISRGISLNAFANSLK